MVFEDEASFYRQPTVARAFAPKGRAQPRCGLSPRSNSCVRAAVAFDPVSGNSTHLMRSSFTVSAVGAVYRAIAAWTAKAERVVLVMDNWPVHYHERALKALREDPRLEIKWLPTYSPWLNPAEKVWKWVRQKRGHMHNLASDMTALRAMIDGALTQAESIPAEMLKYTGMGKSKLYGT